MITIHLHAEEDHGELDDPDGLVQGECVYSQEDNSWTVTITNTLDELNLRRGEDITVFGWKRGRYDTIREGEETAHGRAFGAYLTTDIIPGEELVLRITQDEPMKPHMHRVPVPLKELSVKAKLQALQAQIEELSKEI